MNVVCNQKKRDIGARTPPVAQALLFLGAAVLAACGPGADEHPVPPGAQVQIEPQDFTWTIVPAQDSQGNPVCLEGVYNDHTFVIRVVDANGSPLGEVDLRVRLDLAGNTSSGPDVLRLYDDYNGNGVVDHPQELVSAAGQPALFTRTAKYTGEKIVLVRVNLSCTYRATLTAIAGSAHGSASIEVNEQEGG